ncbi:polysaccharide biosynthesis/export family protein [Agaribacter flavus]|uniref:Polysaccharide biosynthesis/export family protein n=1 Tax=Agaribacter flavus TaxID=1902781 RepID=A0ABV7FU08_9ALTE
MIKNLFVLIIVLIPSLAFGQSNVSQEKENVATVQDLENFINTSEQQTDIGQNIEEGYEQIDEFKPFGHALFDDVNVTQRRVLTNPEYLLAAGDKISVQLWGAVNQSDIHIVDNQLNLFIPNVGPINLQDVTAQNLNQVVSQKIKSVYTDNVNIYVNLLATTPVGVMVSGGVSIPGVYAGTSSDSVLFYLKRAGGIDPKKGSYRSIKIIRNGELLQTIDLYDFLTKGKLVEHAFKDGDVIFASFRGPSVSVTEGETRLSFEFSEDSIRGSDLVELAKPDVSISHIAINGVRDKKPIALYLSRDEFLNFTLRNGDELLFNEDLRPQVISVELSGSYLGPSFYAVPTSTRLSNLLDYVEVDPEQANLQSIYVVRESVKQQQKELLDASLSRLERNVYTAPASSDGEARLRAQEAQLVSQFIERARQIEPTGKVVVSIDGKAANILLEQGDTIVIPPKSDLINISGEVVFPQAIVFNEGASIKDYINWAGGYSDRANQDTIVILHTNGASSIVSLSNTNWFSGQSDYKLAPGDQILVLPKVDEKLMQSVKDITQIIFQIAVAANVAFD